MDDPAPLDVLAFGAHPDDVEITSGGLLVKMMRRGRRTGVIDLTRGEMGTHGDEEDRSREAAAAATVLGLVYRENLEIADSGVELTHENKLRLAAVIRLARPELVILPHWEQRHPDHLACCRLVYDACYLAGLRKLPLNGEPHRPRKIVYASYYRNDDYSFLVDISEEFEQKIEAVAAYRSQFGDLQQMRDLIKQGVAPLNTIQAGRKDVFSPGINIFDLMYTRGRYLGQKAGVRFAEAYTIKEKMLIDDPQKMPVNSI